MSTSLDCIFFTLAKDLVIFLEVHCGFYFPTCVLDLANVWPVFCYIYQFISYDSDQT